MCKKGARRAIACTRTASFLMWVRMWLLAHVPFVACTRSTRRVTHRVWDVYALAHSPPCCTGNGFMCS